MKEIKKIVDSRVAAIELRKELKRRKITNNKFCSLYEKELIDGEFDIMLKGGYFYNDRMNKVASHFLGIEVDCKKRIDPIISLRKGMEEGKIKDLIMQINSRFVNIICKKENAVKFKYKFNNIKEFKKNFDISKPLTIEKFLKMNCTKDNFIVIKDVNEVGISGLATKFCVDEIIYNCLYVNTREPYGRQIFTFFHELYHIYFEESDMHILEDYEYSEGGKKIENRAHQFASELMIDNVELFKILEDMDMSCYRNIERKDIYYIQKRFNATFQAVIYKIEQLEKSLIEHIKNKKLPNEELEIKEITKCIPKIPKSIKKYYNNTMWEELNERIKNEDPENILNFPTYDSSEFAL